MEALYWRGCKRASYCKRAAYSVLLTSHAGATSIPSRLLSQHNGDLVATPLTIQFFRAEPAAVTDVSPMDRPVEKKSDKEDEELVRAAQRGDRSAFGVLYVRYARMVHGILLGRVPAGAVEDLVQDVFLKAMPRVGSLRDAGHFGGWLAAIARNRAVDFFRQANPSQESFEDTGEVESQNRKSDGADKTEAESVLAAIRRLPEAYRETLILRLVEGMTGPEIATRTGLTHGSVRVNLHRGMQQLRMLLEGGPSSAVKR
jgi:RNA polymerase sigma-70 factor, ECF subfamily